MIEAVNKCNKVVVLCHYEFPVGFASTTRILAYCSGLIKNGVLAEIFVARWIADNEGQPISGVVNGIPYKNSHLWHTKRGKLYKHLIDKPLIRRNAISDIKESNRNLKIDWVLISDDNLDNLEYFVPRLKREGFRIAFIGDEYPEPMRTNLVESISPDQIKRYKKIYEKIDARILMTKSLQDFYDKLVCPKPSFILPSIIDATRFDIQVPRTVRENSNYLCYMGGFEPTSDNLDVMIKAFARVLSSYPELELRLYGAPSEQNRRLFEKVAIQESISAKVRFMGRVENQEVPNVLANAKIVLTSQPDNIRIRGSFSTKIGEYIASGTPTLVTEVGSIPLYFEHNKNIFFARVNDIEDYAHQILYILSDYSHAMDVAEEGKRYIKQFFNAEFLTKGLVTFLEKVASKN